MIKWSKSFNYIIQSSLKVICSGNLTGMQSGLKVIYSRHSIIQSSLIVT